MYMDSSPRLLASPAVAVVLSGLRMFVNWFGQQLRTKKWEPTWRRGLLVGPRRTPPAAALDLRCGGVPSLGFLILSPCGGTGLRHCSRPLFFFLVSGKTLWGNVTRCVHMCTHPWTQERDASTHIRVWSSDAVSWSSEIKVSSSQLPSPPRYWFFNLQHSYTLKKDLVL